MQIFDNFLDDTTFKNIQDLLIDSGEFPWYYVRGKIKKELSPAIHDFQFTHNFYSDMKPNQYFNIVFPLVSKISPSSLMRIKANMTTILNDKYYFGYHNDYDVEKNPHFNEFGRTAIFYVNTNNGVTSFKNGTEVQSVENRLVVFSPKELHAGINTTDTSVRCVINLNYYPNI